MSRWLQRACKKEMMDSFLGRFSVNFCRSAPAAPAAVSTRLPPADGTGGPGRRFGPPSPGRWHWRPRPAFRAAFLRLMAPAAPAVGASPAG